MFGQITPEQQQENIRKAQEARAAKAAHNKEHEHLYKLTYLDQNHWAALASENKIRMPAYNEPCTAKGIRKYLKKAGVSNDTWKEHYTSVEYFLENNKKWTMYSVAGLILELREGV